MNIDEENEIFDISDHNLIEVKLHQNQRVNQKDRYAVRNNADYFSTDPGKLKEFSRQIEEELKKLEEHQIDINEVDKSITKIAEKTLKQKQNRKNIKAKENMSLFG